MSNVYFPWFSMFSVHRVLNVKVLVGTFNQEEALVGAFSMIVKLRLWFVCNSNSECCNSSTAAHLLLLVVSEGGVGRGVGAGGPARHAGVGGAATGAAYQPSQGGRGLALPRAAIITPCICAF